MTTISGLAVNGRVITSHIRELKADVSLEQAYQAGQKDGLDQVYFEAAGRKFVASGDGLAIKDFQKGELPYAQVKVDGQIVNAELRLIDNETNTAWEGVKNLGKWMIGEGVAAGGLAGYQWYKCGLHSGEQALGYAMGGFASLVIGAVAIGATAAGGALYGGLRGKDEHALDKFIRQ